MTQKRHDASNPSLMTAARQWLGVVTWAGFTASRLWLLRCWGAACYCDGDGELGDSEFSIIEQPCLFFSFSIARKRNAYCSYEYEYSDEENQKHPPICPSLVARALLKP